MTSPAAAAPKGVDYSESHPSITALKAGGYAFVVRYLSLTVAKNLTAPERDALLGAGIKIALVWETSQGRMLGGRDAGKWDALKADTEATALKMVGIPLYFACDFDATEAQQPLINGYLDGVADSIGRDRTGIYGGYWPVSRALNAGKAAWAWQTYAWSAFNPGVSMPAHAVKWEVPPGSGHWFFADTRAQLRQGPNGVQVGGADVDLDHAYAADFGQWPRPSADPQPFPSGWHRVGDPPGTLAGLATRQGRKVSDIIYATAVHHADDGGFGDMQAAYVDAADWAARLTPGMMWYLP